MKKVFILLVMGLLGFVPYSYACSNHVTKNASAELLKSVPNLKTTTCAQDALMQIAIGSEYAKSEHCYKMSEEEFKKASAIVEKKEVMDALKEVYSKKDKHKH